MILITLFRFAFASASQLHRLTSHHIVTRRPVLQKVRRRALNALRLLVNLRFQVLFHSPPGVLFTFPSRYYSLSVTWSYLALRDGPRLFRQNSSCSDVLVVSTLKPFRLRDCHSLWLVFPDYSARISSASDTRAVFLQLLWAIPLSLATTHGIVFTFFSSGY